MSSLSPLHCLAYKLTDCYCRIPSLYYQPRGGGEFICTSSGNNGIHQCSGHRRDSGSKIHKYYPDLPAYREGGKACELTPEQLGEGGGGGCVNWNIFYTNCTTGPHNPHHGAVSFDNIGINIRWRFLSGKNILHLRAGLGCDICCDLSGGLDGCDVLDTRCSLFLQLCLLCCSHNSKVLSSLRAGLIV